MAHSLALAIPTYARSEAVAENLELMAAEAASLGVSLYYSDDSRDDRTETVVRRYAERFGNIRYCRNAPSLGHDKNVVQTLLWPDTDYVWLLGDVWRPAAGELERIVDFLDGQDLIFLNREPPDGPDRPCLTGAAADTILREKLWNQTLTGATIYHRRVCEWTRDTRPEIRRNFPQLSIILGFAGYHPASIGWFSKNILESAPKAESYWSVKALDVFVDDWVTVVTAHPDVIPEKHVADVLKSHSGNTNLFSLINLLILRKDQHFNWASLRRPHFWDVMHKGRLGVLAVLLLPKSAVRGILALKAARRRRKA